MGRCVVGGRRGTVRIISRVERAVINVTDDIGIGCARLTIAHGILIYTEHNRSPTTLAVKRRRAQPIIVGSYAAISQK